MQIFPFFRDYQTFSGTLKNSKTANASLTAPMTDHFTTMLYTHLTDEALLVGARNILYKLSVDELRLKQTLTWHSLGELKKEYIHMYFTKCGNFM